MKRKTSWRGRLGILAAALAFWNCKAPASVDHQQREIQRDSADRKVETVIQQPSRGSMVIHNICDSITGQAVDLEYTFAQGADTTRIRIQDGDLTWDVQKLDSIKSRAVSEYRSRIHDLSEKDTQIIREEKTPGWAWYSLCGNILAILGAGIWLGVRFKTPKGWAALFGFLKRL